jgi:hypothetical protein
MLRNLFCEGAIISSICGVGRRQHRQLESVELLWCLLHGEKRARATTPLFRDRRPHLAFVGNDCRVLEFAHVRIAQPSDRVLG